MILNTQPTESMLRDEEGSLQVQEIWSTIQGEGPFVGTPAIFVRLTGCNLQCPLCDTDYTSVREVYTPEMLYEKIAHLMPRPGLVVFTGGEPLRQNLQPAIIELLRRKRQVQIETNGTYFASLPFSQITVVCSPKTSKVHSRIEPFINAYKYVLKAEHIDVRDGLPTTCLGYDRPPARPPFGYDSSQVYVQPCDEQDEQQNKANTQATLESAMTFGYRFALQVHKIVGLP